MLEHLLKELVKESIGVASKKKGDIYESYLERKFKDLGVKTGGTAGSGGGADLVLYDSRGNRHGIEVKFSQRADMGSASLAYDHASASIIVKDSSSISQAIVGSGKLQLINSDSAFIKNIAALHNAGLLNKEVPSEKLIDFKKLTGLPTQPGRSIKLENSDVITKHYAAKRDETPAYVQIRNRGLYILNSEYDPLEISKYGSSVFKGNVSISVKVAQKGSSSPGRMSNLKMSAKLKLTGGLPPTGLSLDTNEGMMKFVKALGF